MKKLINEIERMQEIAGVDDLNENQDLETFERIEGLANTQDLKILQDKLRIIFTDLYQEGFEKTDFKNYIVNYIDQI